MTADHSPTIAFTNGAFTDIDKDTSVEWIAGHADGVQLVAFTADELDHAIEGWAARCNDQQLPVVALHAPGVDIGRPTSQLVARLADAIPDVPIVAHPDVMGDLLAWRHLGSRLLVETMDPGKATGSTIAQIDAILEQLPAAGVCVDVSHSLSAGGPALPVAMPDDGAAGSDSSTSAASAAATAPSSGCPTSTSPCTPPWPASCPASPPPWKATGTGPNTCGSATR